MISLYQDPKGEHIFSHEDNTLPAAQLSDATLSTFVSSARVDCTDCQHLRAKIKQLEEHLKELGKVVTVIKLLL